MSTDFKVYTLHRFIQFREKSVHCLRTQEFGEFVGVIFTSGDAEIHDLRKDIINESSSTRKTLLRLRNVIDLCFISIPITSIIETEGDNNNNNECKNGLLIARQNSSDEYIRLGMFIEYEIGFGWTEIPISVELPKSLIPSNKSNKMNKSNNNNNNNINNNNNKSKPFEIPITSISGYILRGYGNIIAMCSNEFKFIYVWRIIINKYKHQSSLIKPISLSLSNNKIYCMILTKHALFASDLNVIRISPAPSVLWNGHLQLKVPKIYKLSIITSQLIAGINDKHKLFIFGVDRKNQNFKAFFVMVQTPLPVTQCTSFPIIYDVDNNNNDNNQQNIIHHEIDNKINDDTDNKEKEEEKVMIIKDKDNKNEIDETRTEIIMGWNTNNKYLLSLKTPNYPQLYIVILDSMFVTSILRSKETKREVKLTNFASKIVCTFSNTLQIVPLYPDIILIPNQHDIHAFLFTFK